MNDKLAKRPKNEIREWLESPSFKAELAKALPQTLSVERYVRITATAMMRNPRLAQCTHESFFRCLLDLSALGLEPDARNAHLIPRRNKAGGFDCGLIVDYKGIKQMLFRHDDIIDEHSDVVGDNDIFTYEFGTHKHLTHRPDRHDRGRIYCAYSYVTLPKGGSAFEVMSVAEIESIRQRSAAANDGPWVKDWSEMAKKTVFKRLAKSLPLSPKTRDAIELDNVHEAVVSAEPSRAHVAGSSALPFEISEGPESESEPVEDVVTERPPSVPPKMPRGGPRMAPERAQPPNSPATADQTLARLKSALNESGYSETEFYSMMKANQLLDAKTFSFAEIPADKMQLALDHWTDALEHLRVARKEAEPLPEQREFQS